MLVIARQRGATWPPLRDWLRMAPVGALLFLGGNGFVAIAEQSVSSGGAAVVCATMPLWVGVLGAVVRRAADARASGCRSSLGFVGVIVLMGGPSLAGKPLHIVFAGAARRSAGRSARCCRAARATSAATHGSLDAAGDADADRRRRRSASSALVRGEHCPAHASAQAWLAVALSVRVRLADRVHRVRWLLRNARPVVATSYAYVNPILAVLIGAALAGEPLGWTTLVANVLIVAAVMLALRTRRSRKWRGRAAFR